MATNQPARIHPTALISPDAQIAEDVIVGPYTVIDGPATIGAECIIGAHVQLSGAVRLGRGNRVFKGAVIGEEPQHLRFAGEETSVEIGDYNIFRENVTIHRGTTESWTTRIGNNNFFMVGSHVAHDCIIGNHCILANNALVAGHCVLEDSVYLSGNAAIHQFTRIGRLAMLSGCSATTKDMPPFIIQQGINNVTGVNLVGMKRAGMPSDQIDAVRQAFRILFMGDFTLPVAMAKIEQEIGHVEAVREMLSFLSQCKRGINLMRNRAPADSAA